MGGGGLVLVPPHPVHIVEDQRAPVYNLVTAYCACDGESGASFFFFGCGNIQLSFGMCQGHWELGRLQVQALDESWDS
jgi:hypothetical protein